MRQENREAAAAAIVEGELAVSNLAELHGRLEPCFRRVEPFAQAGMYMAALMSELPRKNGWTIAEHAGDATPDRMQRQYMGCAGRIANGVNTVYCSYATPGGHALAGARIYLPADQLDDPHSVSSRSRKRPTGK